MKKALLVLMLTLCVLPWTIVAAQQGTYVRKSITALDTVYVFPLARPLVYNRWAFDMDRFQQFLQFYIEMPRFDFNEIPKHIKHTFSDTMRSHYTMNAQRLTELVQQSVVDEIITILNDPDIQRARSTNFKDEASFQTFAATKAQSYEMTSEELAALFNSAYIYLPYISSASVQFNDEGHDIVHIAGGIIWWKIDVAEDGTSSIRQVLQADTWTMGFVDYHRSDYSFSFGNMVWYLTAFEYAVHDAMLAFAKNLSVETRKLDEFKLQAQIVQSERKTFSFPLGRNEGIQLDDGFYIMGYREGSDGSAIPYRKGYGRVVHAGDNISDPSALSSVRQLMGTRASIGDVLMENPRLGIDMSVYGGKTTQSSIKPEHITAPSSTTSGITSEINSQLHFGALFSYNLAPILQIPQIFLTLDAQASFPNTSSEDLATLSVLSPYFGISKGVGGRLYARVGISAGLDFLTAQYSEHTIIHKAFGVKGMLEFGYMLSANWRVALFGSYKYGFEPYATIYKKHDIEQSSFIIAQEGLQLGGVTAAIGFTYALGSLPFNLFGFLDTLKQ
jgi:hypothetical protein